MTEISFLITVIGICLSIATFYVGRQTASKADGRAAGALETDLRKRASGVLRASSTETCNGSRDALTRSATSSQGSAIRQPERMSRQRVLITVSMNTSSASMIYRLRGETMRRRRKKKKEFSKTILRTAAAATIVIVVFSFALMWKTGDTSPLAYIIPGIFAELSAATGFYFWKAKAENEIKLDALRRQKKLEQQQTRETPGENDPGNFI